MIEVGSALKRRGRADKGWEWQVCLGGFVDTTSVGGSEDLYHLLSVEMNTRQEAAYVTVNDAFLW